MAKVTLENGMVFEGTNDELVELLAKLSEKFPVSAEEQAPKYKQIDGSDVRVGDFVKFTDYKCDTTVGKYYEITGFDGDGDPTFKDDEDDVRYVFIDSDDAEFYRLAAGTLVGEVAEEKPELKVGDVVRLNIEDGESPYYGWGGVSNGDVGEVKGVYEHKVVVDFENNSMWSGKPTELTRLTEEEVAAKAQAEVKREADKWAKIGRKPGEYKKGDIARITKYQNGLPEGSIFAVTHAGASTVGTGEGFLADVECIELITPVESRFDLAMDGDQDDAK